jgi:hypothetical protein
MTHVYSPIGGNTRPMDPHELKYLFLELFGTEYVEGESEETLMNRAFEACGDPIFVGSADKTVYVLWNTRRVQRLRELDKYVTEEWLQKALGSRPMLQLGEKLTDAALRALRAFLNGKFRDAMNLGLFTTGPAYGGAYLTNFLRARGSRNIKHTGLLVTLWMRNDTGAQYAAVYRDAEYLGAYEVGLTPDGPRALLGGYVDRDPQLTGRARDDVADALSDILRLA